MFSLGPTWETVSKGRPQADCVSWQSPSLKGTSKFPTPFYVLDNSPKPARAGSSLQIQARKAWEQETARAWRTEHWKPHKNRRHLFFRKSRAKTSLVVLNNVQQCHIYLCPSDVIFDTKTLWRACSQALNFNVTFDKSFVHFFSTDIYWANSSRCQKHKDEYPPGLLLESNGDNGSLLHLQSTYSVQSTSHTSSNLILGNSLAECR